MELAALIQGHRFQPTPTPADPADVAPKPRLAGHPASAAPVARVLTLLKTSAISTHQQRVSKRPKRQNPCPARHPRPRQQNQQD